MKGAVAAVAALALVASPSATIERRSLAPTFTDVDVACYAGAAETSTGTAEGTVLEVFAEIGGPEGVADGVVITLLDIEPPAIQEHAVPFGWLACQPSGCAWTDGDTVEGAFILPPGDPSAYADIVLTLCFYKGDFLGERQTFGCVQQGNG